MSKWLKEYDDEVFLDVFDHPYYFRWWSIIKMKAALRPRFVYPGKLAIRVRITYGEWAVTILSLAKDWDADPTTISRFLQALEDEGLITIRKQAQATIISIVNFERYYSAMPVGGEGESFLRSLTQSQNEIGNGVGNVIGSETSNGIGSEIANALTNGICNKVYDEVGNPLITREREKNKNFETDMSAREKEFFEELKNSDLTIEQMSMSLRVDKEVLLSLLEEFYNYSVSTDQFHQDFSRFKSHFLNWARKQHRENISQTIKSNNYGKKTNTNSTAGTRSAERRGSEGSGVTVDDYSKPLPD